MTTQRRIDLCVKACRGLSMDQLERMIAEKRAPDARLERKLEVALIALRRVNEFRRPLGVCGQALEMVEEAIKCLREE